MMQEAIFNTQDQIAVSAEMVDELKRRAAAAPRGRFRLCLHRSTEDAIQEMMIACVRGTYFRPHRSVTAGSKSYYVISGDLCVVLFDDDGRVKRRVEMGTTLSGRPFVLRFDRCTWHMPIALSDTVVYVEVNEGPFRKEQHLEYASWSPQQGDKSVPEYLAQLLSSRPTSENCDDQQSAGTTEE